MKPMHMSHKVNNPKSSRMAQFFHRRILFPLQLLIHILPGYANGDDDEIASNLPRRSPSNYHP
jgi:hypothetical protein